MDGSASPLCMVMLSYRHDFYKMKCEEVGLSNTLKHAVRDMSIRDVVNGFDALNRTRLKLA